MSTPSALRIQDSSGLRVQMGSIQVLNSYHAIVVKSMRLIRKPVKLHAVPFNSFISSVQLKPPRLLSRHTLHQPP